MAGATHGSEFQALIGAAERQHGAAPSVALRDALNAYARLPAGERPDNLGRLAAALPDVNSPSGAGYLAIWLGAGVEAGDDPEPAIGPLLDTFMKWSRTLRTASDDTAADEPEPDEDTILGLRLLGQSLVAHLSRAPGRRESIAAEAICDELERVEHLSQGAGWLLHLLRQRSGQVVVLNVEKRLGVLVRYENIANCFHFFTLLQGALVGVMPDARETPERILAIARGRQHDEASDEAWWHYGQANFPRADHLASVWGEMGPDHISRIDDVQVLLLWPKVLGRRSWDSSFFAPVLEATPPDVQVVRALSKAEVQQWWSRLGLPQAKPWWKLR